MERDIQLIGKWVKKYHPIFLESKKTILIKKYGTASFALKCEGDYKMNFPFRKTSFGRTFSSGKTNDAIFGWM